MTIGPSGTKALTRAFSRVRASFSPDQRFRQAWFADVLTKLASGHLTTRLDELLPWSYAQQAETAVA
ncbi:hypothetical protein Sp245p_31710 (plasmid) [Azospirillum baldaniorum]|uniref:transposase domain-containing protein n=1 Tax=Azospirillum baldaniorum TaxID=1064539 RepID=UPI000696FBA7|nr:transposase domain-containing protein [Azospirillum baldaniorum]AWJ94417.1 hypothetical protein Sp245p_31710 [Azospirillum baldaniorum]